MNSINFLARILPGKENLNRSARISLLLVFILSACGPAGLGAAPLAVQTTPVETLALPLPAMESPQVPSSTPEATEQLVTPYYLPLAIKPDIAPQTIDGVTVEIDWAYVDESRIALQFTMSGLDWVDGTVWDAMSVRVGSAAFSDVDFSGAGR